MLKNFVVKCALLLIFAFSASACQTTGPASIKGECQAFTNPGFAVQGKRRLDQRAIDHWLETGITICDWPRPKQ